MVGVKLKTTNKWKVLCDEEIRLIHEKTLTLLENVGIVIKCPLSRKIFKNEGAKVSGEKVFIPHGMIEETIKNAPARVTLHGRHPSRDLNLGEGRVNYTSCFGPVKVRDPGGDKLRPATLEDLEKFTLLSDNLENIACCLFHVRPSEIRPELHDLYSAATMLKITDKHIHFSQDNATNTETLIALAEIAAADAGIKQPIHSLGGCSTTPLIYDEEVCKKLRLAVAKKIPFFVVSGGIAGATTPVTLAGTLLIQNAEVLAGLALGQLLSPGAPMVYGCFSGGMDMTNGRFVMGGAELAIIQAATAQICAFYEIPFGYGSGGWTDAAKPGFQAGLEKGTTLLSTALSGVEVIHSAAGGMLGGANIADYIQMMIDDEVCDMVNRFLRGIEVSEDTLSIELINHIGPGGHFLDDLHTTRLFKQEHFIPRLLDRSGTDQGDDTVISRAKERLEQILKTCKPKRPSTEACREIDAIVNKIAKEI